MDYISQANVGGTTYAVGLPNVYINSKGNFNIETSAEIGNTSKGKINIESMHDIQLKPGDDIALYSHHRAKDKQDEVLVKVVNGSGEDDIPVKLQLNAAELTISTKDKTGNNANVFDVNVNSGQNQKGYLKVRAQAIDLRCEDHGGIALQPKGADSSGNMNKIKFEHGGGDGLEFGTFNAEKTSIFTNEYRFNKDGVWKMAIRNAEDSDKIDEDDSTTYQKYQKNNAENNEALSEMLDKTFEAADDFYDFIDVTDPTATTEDIIKTSYALNGAAGIHTKITDKGNLEIETSGKYIVVEAVTTPDVTISGLSLGTEGGVVQAPIGTVLDASELSTWFTGDGYQAAMAGAGSGKVIALQWSTESLGGGSGTLYLKKIVRDINIESAGGIKLKGVLDFGSTFNFGETNNGIETIIKRTAKDKTKDCEIVKVVAVNNSSSAFTFNTIWDPTANDNAGANQTETTVSLDPGTSQVIAQCSMYDIIKLVNYMKDKNEGPWASQS